ncbi:MAG: DsbA family protein [Anaerolineaceae bacterium]|nr:MAG: DsbA family protein [Anaerolineaceae bacterium]
MSKRADIREKRRRQRRRRQLITILIVLGPALIVLAIIIWPQFAPIGDISVPEVKSYPMADGLAMGDPQSPVVIEEYSDFLCAFCGTFHGSTLGQIVEQYVATGQVYFVFNPLPPRRENSIQSAHASLCASEQGQFWQYADILFANQASIYSTRNIDRLLEAMAETADLDIDRFQSCMRENRYEGQIQDIYSIAISYGIESTPSFLINGNLFRGAQPFSEFQAEIEAALSEAASPSP